MVQLSVGEEYTLPTATAIDNVDGNITNLIQIDNSQIISFFNLNINKYVFTVAEEYEIVYSVTDSSGNTAELILQIKVIVEPDDETPNTPEYSGYYESIDGLTGIALQDALYTLLNNMGGKPATTTYGEARYLLEETDKWIEYNEDYLYLIYTDTLKGSSSQGYPDHGPALAQWDSGATWNREHVWAKSLFGTGGYDPGEGTRGIDADLHNLRAADTTVNSTRGNNKFIAQVYNVNGFGNYNSQWYPGDHHRGDVARILFYMDIRWGLLTDLLNIGDLATLIQWHKLDPVDEFEIRRNNLIHGYQGNRNPFIDHPELVDAIYN